MGAWMPMSETPMKPMAVLYYCSKLAESQGWKDGPSMGVPGRDEQFALGHFDGEAFCFQATGHEVFEWPGDETDPDKPTHWQPLPKPPAATPETQEE